MDQYLSRYAEAESAGLSGLPDAASWANVIVIPARGEKAEFLDALVGNPPPGGPILLILVINGARDSGADVRAANQALNEAVHRIGRVTWRSSDNGLRLLVTDRTELSVMLVDRFSAGRELPAKGGVGHARKIGADLAAAMIHAERLSTPWIHCSDADARLPGKYFTAAALNNGLEHSALVYPFQHCDADHGRIDAVTQLYELSLRYYVAALTRAGSPYAFHTIGSTMAVRARAYAKVRGFPRRQAGEDFYLLNKLAKLAPVRQLREGRDCGPIVLQSRLSDRVPFGTGAAVGKLLDLQNPWRDYSFYNPRIFDLLARWLQVLPGLWSWRESDPDDALRACLSDTDGCRPDRTDIARLWCALQALAVPAAITHAWTHSKNPAGFSRQMHTWFDAFRTLKMVHFLRDRQYPSIAVDELADTPQFRDLMSGDRDLGKNYSRARRLNRN